MQDYGFFVLSPSRAKACINFPQARKALRCAPEQVLARQTLMDQPQTRKPALAVTNALTTAAGAAKRFPKKRASFVNR
jgi:hypothetical protein